MSRTVVALFSAVLLCAGAAQAQTFRADNRVAVTPVGADTFATSTRGSYGARGAWCAAADYAKDVLGASSTTRIFVREGEARPSGQVIFGVGAGGTTPVAVSSVGAAIRIPGSNLSVAHAFQFCHDARIRPSR